MNLKVEIDRNINHLYSTTEWIKSNEQAATVGDIPTKTEFVKTLLFYENLRKDTIILLEAYFKQEQGVHDFNYRKLYKRLKEE